MEVYQILQGGIAITFYETLAGVIDEEWYNITVTFAEPWEIPWAVPVGTRDDYEIHFLEKGKGRFFVGGREYAVSKGDIVCLHSMEGNSFIVEEEPIRFIFLTFKIDPVKNPGRVKELNSLLAQERFPLRSADPQKIQEILYRMHKEISLKSGKYMFRIKLLLGELVSGLMDQYKENDSIDNMKFNVNRKTHELINRIIIHLQENYNREISLEDLGRLVNLHPRYLCTLFRQVSGKTVSEFLREIRIEKAKRLLAYTSLSITDIALETGFSNSQYFSRTFSRSEGMDPRTYRKSRNNLI